MRIQISFILSALALSSSLSFTAGLAIDRRAVADKGCDMPGMAKGGNSPVVIAPNVNTLNGNDVHPVHGVTGAKMGSVPINAKTGDVLPVGAKTGSVLPVLNGNKGDVRTPMHNLAKVGSTKIPVDSKVGNVLSSDNIKSDLRTPTHRVVDTKVGNTKIGDVANTGATAGDILPVDHNTVKTDLRQPSHNLAKVGNVLSSNNLKSDLRAPTHRVAVVESKAGDILPVDSKASTGDIVKDIDSDANTHVLHGVGSKVGDIVPVDGGKALSGIKFANIKQTAPLTQGTVKTLNGSTDKLVGDDVVSDLGASTKKAGSSLDPTVNQLSDDLSGDSSLDTALELGIAGGDWDCKNC